MTSEQIRTEFINYFKSRSKVHENVASSALIPANDPSLLFTNAGMVQFKDVFLGIDKRTYSRAVTSQKCLRVGGKHNDLDQVGLDQSLIEDRVLLEVDDLFDLFLRDSGPVEVELDIKDCRTLADLEYEGDAACWMGPSEGLDVFEIAQAIDSLDVVAESLRVYGLAYLGVDS